MNERKIRLRSAPSPTGSLHIGNLKTIIFTYLIARKLGGKLILRIEDTDQKREVPGAIDKFIEILEWIGIKYDEGPEIGGEYGPYIQSQRGSIYREYIKEILDKDGAYPCFCSAERLEKMRAQQQEQKLPPRYDRTCRDLDPETVKARISAGEKYVIRQKLPLSGEVVVHDELRGDIKFRAEDLDDHVLVKNNGIPTYQFASVVDDHTMEISHVTRAEEWISSFPKNILLYRAFGWIPPKFFHFPVILSPKGGKLSKRDGDVAVEEYKQKGYIKEALINFCALLGWHPRDENEIMTLDEIIQKFRIEDMGASPAVFLSDKLDYLNGVHIRRKDISELTELCLPYLQENLSLSANAGKKEISFISKAILLEQERLKRLDEISGLTNFLFIDQPEYEPALLIWKKMDVSGVKKNLAEIMEILNRLDDSQWDKSGIEAAVMAYLQTNGLRVGEYLWPMRVALSGSQASPGPFEIADVLGKNESISRINYAFSLIDGF